MENNILTIPSKNQEREQQLQYLENKIQKTIPEPFRKLLIQFDGFTYSKTFFTRNVTSAAAVFPQGMSLESVMSISEMIKAEEIMNEEDRLTEQGLLSFGNSGGAAVICIGVKIENRGKIYVFDWDFGLTLVAETYKGFIESLKTWDELQSEEKQ